MSDVRELTIAVTAEMAAELRAAVEDGYGSESDVIGEALHDWHMRRHLQTLETDRLRLMAEQGIDSGPGENAGMVFKRLRARLADSKGA